MDAENLHYFEKAPVALYLIGVLIDNDVMILFYSVKDTLSIEIVSWLAE